MAKEMSVSCNFLEHNLTCVLPDNTMDVLLKVRTKSGEHTFREDVYTQTLKYRRWNNKLRPFRSLKRKVANIFRKRNSLLNSSRGTSTQMIINSFPEQCKTETGEKDCETDSDKESIHSNWSDLMPIEINKPTEVKTNDTTQRKRTVRNIVLVPYKPKLKDWGSWKINSRYATSTVASPILDSGNQPHNSDQNNEDKLTYAPHSPYYEPVYSPQF